MIQATLNIPEDFHPVPGGTGHYVAALQTTRGELTALRHASFETWAHLTPLVEILGPKRPGREAFTRQRVHAWVKKVADAVGSHPFFLDVLRLSANHPTATSDGTRPVLSVIHAMARTRHLMFVPVIHLSDADATVKQVADTAACDGRGIALRVPLLGTAPADGRSLDTLVGDVLRSVELDASGADLVMDLGHISEDIEVDVDLLTPLVEQLAAVGSWRSLVLIGTSMPRSLGGGVVEAGSVGRLPRHEWQLWSALRRSGLSRLPTYGDYAVQHPQPPLDVEDGQLPLGLRGNIRYTHETVTVIPRARAPRHEEGREQYRQLCRVLVEQPEFMGREYSWGDEQISDCASGMSNPGWEDHWRGAGTSHHLRFVVDQLAGITH
ncbi:MAG: beta family protein [Chloroflexota bacterium]